MTPELQKEFDELNKYKEFVYLFWDYVEEINYDKEHFTMTITFNGMVLNTREIKLFIEEKEANKMYEVFTLMEQENDIQQDEVEEND